MYTRVQFLLSVQCVEWAHTYFGDCVCSLRDGVSFGLGLVSLVSWAVAEVPQIMTNFFVGSTEGVSLAFLMTWTFGYVSSFRELERLCYQRWPRK